MTDPNNPPAFPIAVPSEFQWADSGMTLRDWFAGQILTGYLRDYKVSIHPDNAETIASNAYQLADAMLAERAKQ